MRRTSSLSLVLWLGTILTASSPAFLGCSSQDPGTLGGPIAVPAPTTPAPPSNANPTPPSGGGGASSGTGNQGGSQPTQPTGNNNNNQGGSTPSGNHQGGGAPSGNNQGGGAPSGDNDEGDAGASTTPAPSADAGSASSNGMYDQFQTHNLAVINMYRATLNAAPLVLDAQLTTFAIAGSTELSMDHSPHQHFINASNDGSIWNDGFTNGAAENQGDPNGWTVLATDPTTNELDQIDAILAAMFAEGPSGGHYQNLMNTQYTRLGVGLLEVDNALYLTNDFSP